MRSVDLVLFDLGSTLLYFDGNSSEVLGEADRRLAQALLELGCPLDAQRFVPTFRERLRTYFRQRDIDFVELTIESVLRAVLAEAGLCQPGHHELRLALGKMYAVTQAHWKLEPDAQQTLADLRRRGCRLGLISNAADGDDVRALLAQNGLEPYFEQVLVSADVGLRKPHPLIFLHALDFFKVPPSRAVMVGDKLGADILGAQNVGMPGIWITRRCEPGAHITSELEIQPDAVISSLSELPDLLENFPVH